MLHVRFSILILTCNKASTKKAPLISTNRDFAKKSSRSIIAASQAEDADSSRVPGLTPGLQGSVNVHRGALLLVP